MSDCCNVVASIECESPPSDCAGTRARCTCYRCGLAVCRPCSKLVRYLGRRVRFCGNCVDDAIRFKERVAELGGAPLVGIS